MTAVSATFLAFPFLRVSVTRGAGLTVVRRFHCRSSDENYDRGSLRYLSELFFVRLIDQCSRGEVGHVFVFADWESLDEVFEIAIGFEAVVTAVLDDGVEHRAAPSGFFRSDEEEVFLSYCGWTNGIFDEVVINLHQSVFEVNGQSRPLPEGVGDSLSQQTFGKMLTTGLKMEKCPVKALDEGAALLLPGDLSDFWACPTFAEFAFDAVEVLDLPQDPAAASGMVFAFEGFVEFPPHMGPARGALDWGGMLFEEGLIALVAVALEGALIVVRHDFFEALVAAPLVPMIADSALFAGDFDDPEVALPGLSVTGVKILEGSFVNLKIRAF